MELKKPKVLVLFGEGINAHQELCHAFSKAGFHSDLVHINQFISNPSFIREFHVLAFPGGFSFSDEVKSGELLSLLIRDKLKKELQDFVNSKKLIIGICNGFQVLMELNAFDHFNDERVLTLTENDHGKFQNFWTEVEVIQNESPWLNNITESFYLPVRHKEGRLFGDIGHIKPVLKYKEDINGSIQNIAGVTSLNGQVFGLMPHPEAALYDFLNPHFVPHSNIEITNKIFSNAYLYSLKEFF